MHKIMIIILLLCSYSFSAIAEKVHGVKIADDLKFSDHSLKLNGAGVRTKFFLDLYVAGLYLDTQYDSAKAIIDANDEMNIRINIISDKITPDRFADATMDGFAHSTHGNVAPIRKEIETMIAVFRNELQLNDVFDLYYQPDVGVEIFRNNVLQATVKGLEFKQALFGIWLSDESVQNSLKKSMLSDLK